MFRGKSICNTLKMIRTQIAEANEIKYEPRECHHQGDCRGTCPACESEVRYLEQQLNLRRQMGMAVAIAGISAGLSALVGCGNKVENAGSEGGELPPLTVGKVEKPEFNTPQLDGDVEYTSPVDAKIVEKKNPKKRTAPFAPSDSSASFTPSDSTAQHPFFGEIVSEMPSFPGGTDSLMKYLADHIYWPAELQDVCVQGRVAIKFIVEKDGSLTDIHVVKSVDPCLDSVAVEVVKSMPKWKPGSENGEWVRMPYLIPVTFRLE